MTGNFIITEFKEDIKKEAQEMPEALDGRFPEDGEEELTIIFEESPAEVGMGDPLVRSLEDSHVVEFEEELPGEMEEPRKTLPGSDADVNMLKDQDEEPEEEPETDWKNDRDVSKFMDFIMSAYPGGIPKHDGRSIVGAERAINYLNDLNKQISEAIRLDRDNVLDTGALDTTRVNMMKDMMTLKNHIKDLQKMVRDQHRNASMVDKADELKKEGSIPIPTLVMTPFERAISGIIINSVVSAGHPFEDVYEYLKKKYEFTDREELAIMQLIMDHGFPIFKDRGLFSSDADGFDEDEKRGLDFMRNYFA